MEKAMRNDHSVFPTAPASLRLLSAAREESSNDRACEKDPKPFSCLAEQCRWTTNQASGHLQVDFFLTNLEMTLLMMISATRSRLWHFDFDFQSSKTLDCSTNPSTGLVIGMAWLTPHKQQSADMMQHQSKGSFSVWILAGSWRRSSLAPTARGKTPPWVLQKQCLAIFMPR